MSNREEDVRVGMSNLAISGNAIDDHRREVMANLRANVGIAAAAFLRPGVETSEKEEAGRRYSTLLMELVKEEQLERDEYVKEIHRQWRVPGGRAEVQRRFRRRLGN